MRGFGQEERGLHPFERIVVPQALIFGFEMRIPRRIGALGIGFSHLLATLELAGENHRTEHLRPFGEFCSRCGGGQPVGKLQGSVKAATFEHIFGVLVIGRRAGWPGHRRRTTQVECEGCQQHNQHSMKA